MSDFNGRHMVFFTSADTTHVVGGSSAAGAPIAGTAIVTLNFGQFGSSSAPAASRRRKVVLRRVDTMRATGASATNVDNQISDVSGAATTAWATKYLGAATAPGTRFTTADLFEREMLTDTSGKLYFTPNADAADTFDYTLAFEVVQ